MVQPETGMVGGLLDAVGGDVVNGAVGGSGLLAGTPLAGIQGDGALASTNAMRDDDSSSSSLLQVGAGTDPSAGLINIDAASNRDTSQSNHIVDTEIGPQTSGNGVGADVLGADRDSSGSLIDADAGQHDGPSLVSANIGTNADQFQFPSLDGGGLDSLIGEVGPIAGDPGGGDGLGLLPVTAGIDGEVLAEVDLTGDASAGDTDVDHGTHLMLNSQNALS
jgi:hypothetical protein